MPYTSMNWPQIYMCPPPSWAPLPPPSSPHPSGFSLAVFGCPASCIELALDFYFPYSSICVSMLFSQIIPHLPSPTVSTCVSFAAPHVRPLLLSFWIPYKCINIQYLSFFFWLTSLCIIGSSFIHLIRADSNVFLFIAEWYSIVCMYHNFLIHSSCPWTSRLLPCPSCCKQCCNEHWGTCVSFNSGFLGVYAEIPFF